ncbi:polyamine ABC transporter substrate-binding protein [Glaciibacter psychrotolerans]|uniref:Putative spermidine/putrescine transport system substrate-binding protein n=1 Tax=Glaciibacter psychrotolerans TaxID=670054 RepID=A0A7Z0EF83_9MICO|nr:ABC transporter substrate-binding protein [Leifsonia psychrotolerans]NYJ20514.1 putative spermidine/putrescine transport system substrate-binding protein [Leifsonia psychrotolerans]
MKKNTPVRGLMLSLGAVAVAASMIGCSGVGGGAVTVDLGSGPAQAGTVKAGALSGVTLTLSSYGGAYQDGQVSAASDPFAKESGATMLSDGPTEYSKIKAQVDNKNVTWDVVDTDAIWAATQCGDDGLLMKIDTTIVDTSKIPDGLAGDCYVPAMQYGYTIMYNTEKYPVAPTGWNDFFDTTKFPGSRAVVGFDDVGPGLLEGALLADGVAQDSLYPLDTERAYAKLDTIRKNLIYWTTGAQSQQMIESGEADMAFVWAGRGYGAAANGAPYKPIWNQAFVVMDSLAVPKNSKNPDAAFAYINYYLGAAQQAKLTELTSYSPVNVDAQPELDALAKGYLITDPAIATQLVVPDTAWWGTNYDVQLERWMKWLHG